MSYPKLRVEYNTRLSNPLVYVHLCMPEMNAMMALGYDHKTKRAELLGLENALAEGLERVRTALEDCPVQA
jgi:hypothetical protein